MPDFDEHERERLARLEERLNQVRDICIRTHEDIRGLAELDHHRTQHVNKRIAKLETEQVRVDTHLRWFKGIFCAVQGIVLALIGWLKLGK